MAGKELGSFISPFISGHLSGFKACCGSEAVGFFVLWPWVWAACVTLADERRAFGTTIRLMSFSWMSFIHWGMVEKLWTWKQALANKEAEGLASGGCARFMSCSTLLLNSRFQAVGKGRRHPLCMLNTRCAGLGSGSGELAGRLLSVYLDLCFPWAASAVLKLLQETVRVHPLF